MPYMTNYEYTCADCGQESLNKKAASVCLQSLVVCGDSFVHYDSDWKEKILWAVYICRENMHYAYIYDSAGFIQVGITALANLTAASCLREELSTQTFFDVETEVISYTYHAGIMMTGSLSLSLSLSL